jgi:hypothetical protein
LPHADAERRRVNDLVAFTNGQLVGPNTVASIAFHSVIQPEMTRANASIRS